MAKGKKTGGKPFQPGNKANPKGGGAITPETRAIRKITNEHLDEVADVILDGNLEKLAELARNPDSSVLKVWIAKSAAEGIKRGDIHPLEVILNRVLGKPKQQLIHSGDPENPVVTKDATPRTKAQILAELKELRAKYKIT